MKNRISKYPARVIILTCTVVILLLLFSGLTVLSHRMKLSLEDQRMAERWAEEGGYAQVSCFFDETLTIDQYQILSFRNEIELGLNEASIVPAGENSRGYVDAYSSQGTVMITSESAVLETEAVGVGGDFFLFHPLELLTGAYFSGDDLMKDHIVIDEYAAWQLFGSNDVVGMQVTIGGVPHFISGVVKRPEGRMWKGSGIEEGIAFVSSETLEAYGITSGINHYEAVIPNPVSGFAYRLVKERFGFDEFEMEVVDNTERYELRPLLTVLADFGLRSMQHYAIQYPYWENYARGYEDILACILVFQCIGLAVPVGIIIVLLFLGYRHRTWTWRNVGKGSVNILLGTGNRLKQRIRNEKDRWDSF